MVRTPRKTAAKKLQAKRKAAKKAASAAKPRTSRFDLQHALDPLASVLKSALLTRAESDAPPPPAKPAARPKPSVPKTAAKRSPLAPDASAPLKPVEGITLATANVGPKFKGRPDLLVAQFEAGTTAAGVFTQSGTAAAPVHWCREHLDRNLGGEARLLIVNAGNANAFTGKKGGETVKTIAQAAAKAGKCRQRNIFMASTGVIGEPLDPEPICSALPGLCETTKPDQWGAAARAIMTTDTFAKTATATAEIDGVPVTINGIAKGSGMIQPDMATMLAFLFTDAGLPGDVLQTLLLLGVRDTFNTVTVDGDTSTNDAVMAFATGKKEHAPIKRPGDRRLADFRRKWHGVMHDLALQIVRDGEGATKLIKIDVTGADTARNARQIAYSIANSPLVKTAVAGEDANWGRIVMAVGKSGAPVDPSRLAIRIGGLAVAKNGERDPAYNEAKLARHMKEQQIAIAVDVGIGSGTATVWTCDLTHGYISINADYRS